MDDPAYDAKKAKAYRLYTAQPAIHSPFFGQDIVLGPEGFRHLCLSAQGERPKDEQIQRFILVPLALRVLVTATTVQTYRRRDAASGTGPLRQRHVVETLGFEAFFVPQRLKIRVIVRRERKDLYFWSVMLVSRPVREIREHST